LFGQLYVDSKSSCSRDLIVFLGIKKYLKVYKNYINIIKENSFNNFFNKLHSIRI
jgi:hypothetical protein